MTAVRDKSWGGVAARVAGVGLALAVGAAAAGCGGEPDGYDPALRYPPRADAVVVQSPPSPPTRPTEPGKLDDALAKFGSLGGRVIDPTRATDADRHTRQQSLDAAFGTPAAPTVPAEVASADPHLSPDALAKGSRLYRRQCAYCHGLSGDGRGPTGVWLVPPPRDFRSGVFKTGGANGKPTPAALSRVIRAGVPGTSMPAFDLIPDADVAALVGYVVHLSLRGEAELRAITADDEDDAGVTAAAGRAGKQWLATAAAGEPPVPTDVGAGDEDAVRRGHALFTGAAGCAGCHADYGRADQYRYDTWGTAARVPDLSRGEHRWGKEPADLARRVRVGIPGAGMPANPGLSDDQVRDVIAFLLALPAPPRLPADVRGVVYPGPAINASAMRR